MHVISQTNALSNRQYVSCENIVSLPVIADTGIDKVDMVSGTCNIFVHSTMQLLLHHSLLLELWHSAIGNVGAKNTK